MTTNVEEADGDGNSTSSEMRKSTHFQESEACHRAESRHLGRRIMFFLFRSNYSPELSPTNQTRPNLARPGQSMMMEWPTHEGKEGSISLFSNAAWPAGRLHFGQVSQIALSHLAGREIERKLTAGQNGGFDKAAKRNV